MAVRKEVLMQYSKEQLVDMIVELQEHIESLESLAEGY